MDAHCSGLRCHMQRGSKYVAALGIAMMSLQTTVQYVPHSCRYGNVAELTG